MDLENENARAGGEPARARDHRSEKALDDLGSNSAPSTDRGKPSFGEAVRPLLDVGLTLIPLEGKRPRDPRWHLKQYDSEAVAAAAEGNHNLGVRIPHSLMVVDVDPRNGGNGSFERLVADCGIDPSDFPTVHTGGGGLHIYMRIPNGFDAVQHHPRYPGIDFKTSGQVVAPGSVHPTTGKRYVGERMELLALEIPTPDALLAVVKRREQATAGDGRIDRAGVLTPKMLVDNLDQLDPEDFRDEATWRELMMACHHATDGAGREEFIEWSTQAAGYGDHGETIGKRWDSLRARDGAITVQTLFKRVLDAGGTPADRPDASDDFDVVDAEPPKPDARWRFLSVEELEALPPPQWLVPGILTEGSIAAIYGAPESGKSFLAVDMAMSVSSGIPWHGRPVMQGGVLYIAAEGATGLGKRVRAWKVDKGAGDRAASFSLMRDPINMTTENEAQAFARAVKSALGDLCLIVVDTLNQTAAGADENSAMEMGRYIASMKLLRDATGATVVVVHHSGKNPTLGMRGSTALLGAMDTTIEVERSTDKKSIEMRIRKQKDAEHDSPIRFNLEKVADSLVLRPTMIAEGASDLFADPIREMAREIAEKHGGRVALKVLIAAVRERDGWADKTARRKIAESIPEGRDNARASIDGKLLWLERLDNNPRGEMVVRAEAPCVAG